MVRRRSFLRVFLPVLVMIEFPVLACGNVLEIAVAPTTTPATVPLPTASPLPTVSRSPQPTAQTKTTISPKASGWIKSVTLALDVRDDSKDPINPTRLFSPNSVFHAVVAHENAPDNTLFKAMWYVVNVGSVAAPNSVINSFETTSTGSGNLDFTLSPKDRWPVGTYRVEIAVNGTVEHSLDFNVAGSVATPTSTVAPKPSGLISSATMARDAKGEDREPVNPTTIFQGKSIFHAIVAIKNAPKNSKFTAVWYVVDVGSASPSNTKIDSSELTSEGTRNIDFSLTPTDTWPVGTYRVDLLVNGVLDQTVTFSVR